MTGRVLNDPLQLRPLAGRKLKVGPPDESLRGLIDPTMDKRLLHAQSDYALILSVVHF